MRRAALACALACRGAAAALPRPDYLGLVARLLPGLDAAYTLRSCAPATAVTPCNSAAELAAVHVALWETRGAANATAAARASQLMGWFVASWATATGNGTRANRDAYDFFACDPIARAFRGLRALPGGLEALGWAAGDVANARLATRDVCGPEMRGMWNQAMSRAAGTVAALATWPDLDEGGAWTAYVRNVLSDWTAAHAYAENSPVYNSIAWFELFALALDMDAAAADADAAAPATLAMGRAWRDLMGPGGYMPAFGDAWSGAGTGKDVWGFEEALYWPASFERLSAAAAAAGNATEAAGFAWAAASYFMFGAEAASTGDCAAGGGDPPPTPPGVATLSARSLRFLLSAEAWRARGGGGVAAAQPPLATRATARRLPPAGAWVPDKLVLTPALTPGGAAPYVMAELLSTSALYHCHVLQLGAVNSFVARNTTFLHHAGRDNYLAEMASTLVVWRGAPARANAFPFPGAAEWVRPGAWSLLELPAANLQPVSQAPEDYYIKNLTHLHFFVNNRLNENIIIDLAYVALTNPDTGAALIIDDFRTVTWPAWPNATVVEDAAAPGPTHRFLRITCAPGKSNNSRPASVPPLALSFDARDYPILQLWWRPSANAQSNDTSLLVIGHGPYTIPEGDFNENTPLEGSNYDFSAGGIGDGAQYDQAPGAAPVATPFHPNFASALDAGSVRAELSPAGDSLGSFLIRRHFSSGVTWTRALVLLAEGPLVALDTLQVAPGDAADGWLAGPSWLLQIDSEAAPVDDVATDFGGFNFTGCYGAGSREASPERLLAAFFAPGAPNASAVRRGTNVAAFVGVKRVVSAFMVAPISAAAPARFVSVLVPHGAGASPAALAALAGAARDGAATVISAPLPDGGVATVTLGDDGAWAVARK